MTKMIVQLVAVADGPGGTRKLGVIDGEKLSIWATEDKELQVTNGSFSLSGGETVFGWEDLVPDYRIGETVRLELRVVDADE